MNETVIAICKCPETKRLYGIRIENVSENRWEMTWTFPIKEETAKREGYDQAVIGGLVYASANFPGCPYCQSKKMTICSQCGKLFCNIGENNVICPWCEAAQKVRGGGKVSFRICSDI
ncbi:MAG: hypothetical protein LBN34_05750 [Clostridiales Family XIII bacterium]|jgi:hypothetical protein|nr:hypothetical protein [Clostridiales Family XIII bacterium]